MISVTKLLFMDEYYGDALRYSHNAHRMKSGAAEGMGIGSRFRRHSLSQPPDWPVTGTHAAIADVRADHRLRR